MSATKHFAVLCHIWLLCIAVLLGLLVPTSVSAAAPSVEPSAPGLAVECCAYIEEQQEVINYQATAWMNFFQDDSVITMMNSSRDLEYLFGAP